MPLDATTIKLTASDKELIKALKEKHGIGSMIEAIRFSMTYALVNAPVEKKKRKSWSDA